jgi:hypothetical protein
MATRVTHQTGPIHTPQDLAQFVRALVASLDQDDASWENRDLKSFLAAAAAWIEDMDGYYRNSGQEVPESPSWETVADMLAAARVYE